VEARHPRAGGLDCRPRTRRELVARLVDHEVSAPGDDGDEVGVRQPVDDLLFEYSADTDLEVVAENLGDVFADIGIGAADVVVSCFAYTPFARGYKFHVGLEAVGANIIPLGPGESDRTADIIENYDVDVLLSPASLAMEIADKGGTDIETVVCSGEPFTVIPGYCDQLKSAFGGATTVDYYALSEVGPVASEDGSEGAMFVVDCHLLLAPYLHHGLGPSETPR
jgi:phenylacetate-CoA ligase